MGLDIQIITDNYEELHNAAYLVNYTENRKLHSLSREFCNLICRRSVIEHEPELEQLGKLTGTDISALYEMENYPDDEHIRSVLEYDADTEEKKQTFLRKVEADRKKLEGNIDRVLQTINQLLDKLELLGNIYVKLLPTDFDTLNAPYYFSDFSLDKGDGYIRNNLGRDLRNFKRFLEYAKERDSQTVWFQFG